MTRAAYCHLDVSFLGLSGGEAPMKQAGRLNGFPLIDRPYRQPDNPSRIGFRLFSLSRIVDRTVMALASPLQRPEPLSLSGAIQSLQEALRSIVFLFAHDMFRYTMDSPQGLGPFRIRARDRIRFAPTYFGCDGVRFSNAHRRSPMSTGSGHEFVADRVVHRLPWCSAKLTGTSFICA